MIQSDQHFSWSVYFADCIQLVFYLGMNLSIYSMYILCVIQDVHFRINLFKKYTSFLPRVMTLKYKCM